MEAGFQAESTVTVRAASGEEEFEATVGTYASPWLIVTLNDPPPPGSNAFRVGHMLSVITESGDRYYVRVLTFKESTNSLTLLIASPMRRRGNPPEQENAAPDVGEVLARLPRPVSEIHSATESDDDESQQLALERVQAGHGEIVRGGDPSSGNTRRRRLSRSWIELDFSQMVQPGEAQNPPPPPPNANLGNLETQPRARNDPLDPLRFLWVFGFCSNPFGGLLFILLCAAIYCALGFVIGSADLEFSHTRPVIFLCVFLPLCCCAFPTIVLVAKVAKAFGIRRFFNFPDGVELPDEAWIIVHSGISLVVFFEVVYLVFGQQNFLWRFIKFGVWTYFLIIHVISFGLFLMRIIMCKSEIAELEALLGTVTGNQRHKINRLRQLERTFGSLSRCISLYTCSLIFVIIVSVCGSLGIFYQKWYHGFKDKDHGAYYFAILSTFQAGTVWILLAKCTGLNSGLKDLSSVARQVNTDARMPENGTVTYTIEILAGLQLIEHNVMHSRARISVIGWEVDASMMIGVFGTHLTFVALTVGAFMSFLESKALK